MHTFKVFIKILGIKGLAAIFFNQSGSEFHIEYWYSMYHFDGEWFPFLQNYEKLYI